MPSKRIKCKRCTFPLSERERAYFMGYCQGCYNDVEEERKRNRRSKKNS